MLLTKLGAGSRFEAFFWWCSRNGRFCTHRDKSQRYEVIEKLMDGLPDAPAIEKRVRRRNSIVHLGYVAIDGGGS